MSFVRVIDDREYHARYTPPMQSVTFLASPSTRLMPGTPPPAATRAGRRPLRPLAQLASAALAAALLATGACASSSSTAAAQAPAATATGQPAAAQVASPSVAPTGLVAEGADRRVDLVWDRLPIAVRTGNDGDTFQVERAPAPDGPWTVLNAKPHTIHVYSDWLGSNEGTHHYRVRHFRADGSLSEPSAVVSASPRAMTRDELLTSVQKATFRYFWDFGHPVSGLARESFVTHPRDTVTIGGSGFGVMAIIVGAERGFVTRDQAAERVRTIVTFLEERAVRSKGVLPHWLHGQTGATIAFAGKEDNGGDIVEHSFMMQALLTARQYFTADNATERDIRERITRLWEQTDWDFYRNGGPQLLWHWSAEYGFKLGHAIRGFNECLITYVLAIASPTHPIPVECYELGWVGPDPMQQYVAPGPRFGIQEIIGRRDHYMPLFFAHYSFLGLDPRAFGDRFADNYFDACRAFTLTNRAWCIANPHGHEGYSDRFWGLTSSFNHDFYGAHRPAHGEDNGTVAPTAALSSMPYTPDESLAAMDHFYTDLGQKLWGPFGFFDAINPSQDWVSDSYLSIDQGPIIVMIENYRTGLLWRLFMQDPDVQRGLEALREDQRARGTFVRP